MFVPEASRGKMVRWGFSALQTKFGLLDKTHRPDEFFING